MPFEEIPTGIVLGGMNAADNELVFLNLVDSLRSASSATHVAVLDPKLHSDVGAMLKGMVKQFVKDGVAWNEDEDEDEDDDRVGEGFKDEGYEVGTENCLMLFSGLNFPPLNYSNETN